MNIFINNGIHNGIISYLNFINNNEINNKHIYEFWVIRILIRIYGEINIINPFKLRKEESFKNNLLIYGLKEIEVDSFIKFMNEYDKWLNSPVEPAKTDIPNKINIILINMILLKKTINNIDKNDIECFDDFFCPEKGDMLKVQNLIMNEPYTTSKLWLRKKNSFNNDFKFQEITEQLLTENDYNRYGLILNEVKQLSNLKIREINNKIITEDSENNEGGRTKFDPKKLILTSGSGFVDTIVLLSIMATEIMIGLLIAFWFLRR
ncbi:MAG: hypothetical protein PHF21_01305 [Bacilli bacterium]|nr:hypothetical protein [Bacilli bacterium]